MVRTKKQTSITEYFSERKSRKRTFDVFKDKDTLPVQKKTLKEDSRKRKNSSKLLVSVLKNQTKLKNNVKKASPKENISLNLKVSLDSSTSDFKKTTPLLSNNVNSEVLVDKRILEKKEFITVEKNNEPSTESVPILLEPEDRNDYKKVQLDEFPQLERSLETVVSKKSQEDVAIKVPKTRQLSKARRQPLPKDYTFLLEVFTCIDSAAMTLYKRGVIITFKKLQPSLQKMDEVTINHLSQIHAIYPEAFSFEKKEIKALDSLTREWEVVLKPNFETDDLKSLEESILTFRKEKFYNELLERVKRQHEQFLKANSKSRSLIGKVKIDCWHPNFDIEKCKPIEMSKLPVFNIIKVTSAKEVLGKVIQCLKSETNKSSKYVENVPNQVEKNDCHRRLSTIIKMIHNVFLNERKNIMTFSSLLEKLKFSQQKLKITELEEDIKFLCKSVPDWISLCNPGRGERVKLNKTIPLQEVLKILETVTKV